MFKLLLAMLPSKIKILYLRFKGAKIGKNCYIGISVVDANNLEIGDNVYIGHFNLLWRLKKFKIGTGSRITMCNWITGAFEGECNIGNNSAITRFHFLEAGSDINIGNNCIIAGRGSHFMTHGITSRNLDDRRAIVIEDWCYIGSSSRVVPGAKISHHTFVGMGSVITKVFNDSYVLIAGAPAIIKKNLSPNDAYFNRSHLPHEHHQDWENKS